MENSFNIYNNEFVGKVYDFDGETGTIVTDNGYYMFFKKDIIDDNKSLEPGDYVSFRVNHYPFGNTVTIIAKFVKKDVDPPQKKI